MNLRTKFTLIIVLLIITTGATLLAARATVGAIQSVHHNQILVQKEDVQLIQPWMTIPYVAHIYHVPETIIYTQLHLKRDSITRHSTLDAIASNKKEASSTLIHQVQSIILGYRHSHPWRPRPTPTPVRGETTSI